MSNQVEGQNVSPNDAKHVLAAVFTKDDLWAAWWASAIKTISFSGVDENYERRCFEEWFSRRVSNGG